MRELRRGETLDPLDLIEWLEEQSYEAEAQVTEKGHVSMRGGIVDFWPLTSPWPVRLEFLGNELESLRYFDPFTQISREEIAGHHRAAGRRSGIAQEGDSRPPLPVSWNTCLRTQSLCCANRKCWRRRQAATRPRFRPNDPFLISWEQFQEEMSRRGMTARLGQSNGKCFHRGRGRRWSAVRKPGDAEFSEPGDFPAHRREAAGAAHCRGPAQEFFQPASSLAAPGLCRASCFATTTANASASRKSGGNTDWAIPARCRCASGALSRGFLFEPAKLVGGDGRGDFWPLQGAASAPAQIAPRGLEPFVAGHQFCGTGGGRLRGAFATRHWPLSRVEVMPIAGAPLSRTRRRVGPARNAW